MNTNNNKNNNNINHNNNKDNKDIKDNKNNNKEVYSFLGNRGAVPIMLNISPTVIPSPPLEVSWRKFKKIPFIMSVLCLKKTEPQVLIWSCIPLIVAK